MSVEKLARAIDPSAYDMFGTFYQREVATLAARRILADPGPLLEALAEAGVLREETSDPHAGHGCWQDPDEREGWQECGSATNERRYVTEWRPTDARA